jgi:SAM-dependent methyltransferase
MNKKQENLKSYNENADRMVKKFNSLLGYPEEIKRIFSVISKDNPKILEIGCGSGRDAKEILKYTNDYLGIDFSKELIKHAKKFVPQARFRVADLDDLTFPQKLDVIFAAASLLHSDKKSLKKFFNKAYKSLNKKGIIFLSLKYSQKHKEERKVDDWGTRTFYSYNIKSVKEIAGKRYKLLSKETKELRSQKWLSLMLQK